MARRNRNDETDNKVQSALKVVATVEVNGKERVAVFIGVNSNVSQARLDALEADPKSLLKWLGDKKFTLRVFEEREDVEGSID